MAKYGLPYMGNKSKVIAKLAEHFPKAKNFYDLFGGGGAVSHFMTESGKYENVFYNELLAPVASCFKDAVDGKYNPSVFKPKWVTREEFFALKETDGYVRTCWSFGNRGQTYLFGETIEQEKRSMHQAVVFDEFNEWFVDTFKMTSFPLELKTIQERRLYLKKRIRELYPDCGERYMVNGKSLQQLQQLEQLERLQQLEQLERLERLERKSNLSCSNLDYRSVEILPDSVVYCDIPYKGTEQYSKDGFDHDAFFEWADAQVTPVFISEYEVNDARFFLVAEVDHRSKLSSTNNSKKTVERLYCNAAAKNYRL